MKAFIDTNVLIDILIPGRQNASEASAIFFFSRTGLLELCLSTQSIIDAAYVTSRSPGFDIDRFRAVICDLMTFVNVHGISHFSLRSALEEENIGDMEDCAQAFFAGEHYCDVIISSDKNFPLPRKMKNIPVMTSREFISHLNRE